MKENNYQSDNSQKILLIPLYLTTFVVALSAVSILFLPQLSRSKLLVLSPPYPSPYPTSICKKGVDSFSLDQICNNGRGFKSASYSCYDNSKGKFTDVNCRSANEFRKVADYACNNLSDPVCPGIPTIIPTYVPIAKTCSEIGKGYDVAFCSSDTSTTPSFSCGNANDPVRKNLCYYDIHVTPADDCSGSFTYCRYYQRKPCGNTHEECLRHCSLYGCLPTR